MLKFLNFKNNFYWELPFDLKNIQPLLKPLIMKKLLFAFGISALILAGCSGGSSKDKSDEAVTDEIEQIEAVTPEMDSTISEIEESAQEVDSVLKE